eukprot:1473111-Amphidinium_carterae.1
MELSCHVDLQQFNSLDNEFDGVHFLHALNGIAVSTSLLGKVLFADCLFLASEVLLLVASTLQSRDRLQANMAFTSMRRQTSAMVAQVQACLHYGRIILRVR